MHHPTMFRATFVAICLLASTALAQRSALEEALDSPIKTDPQYQATGGGIVCSLALPSSAALFGTDRHAGTFVTNELYSPFRVFAYDENCVLLSTWSSAGVAGPTTTGIGFSPDGATYWLCEPFGSASIAQYTSAAGVPTGVSIPVPPGGSVWGGLVVDDNVPGEVLCIREIALDVTNCLDVTLGGSVICSFSNQDNLGAGAFGNDLSDAVSPSDCSGQTLVNASGTITAGHVTRVGQYDCTGNAPECTDRWDVSFGSFVNGICEFRATNGARDLMIADNSSSTVHRLSAPCDARSCQGIDANTKLVWANGSLGGADFTVPVRGDAPLAIGVQRMPAGDGRFVHHMNAGTPNVSTVGPLFDLGLSCFPFLRGSPVVVENNVGRTDLVGASSYFGAAIPNPAKAPTFLASMRQPALDTVNLPIGSRFTNQLLAVNPASSSRRGASLSNAVVIEITFE